eukprot:TRINITY_DN4186_c1_g1_i2.p1 TRINITY_DN4186_c1_g1~~TRINITY_DN4186_c1_g1_i2.p1  ORF type:complete len:261 (+),score=10.18 TRINITY_DN4186_c1_g1_i2:94-876(+)
MGNFLSSGGSTGQNPCPVPQETRGQGVYNVYNERIDNQCCPGQGCIDPRNNMPLQASQRPIAGQQCPLSTKREQASIPKGGTEEAWQYPSPQMFYNALKRKGKGDDVVERDMDQVVAVHNQLNEDTWAEILIWESLRKHECPQPKLLRFTGRPGQISPLARIRDFMGGGLPFDRHDWYIIRNEKEVRYIIDYYYDERHSGKQQAFEIVARPALDSFDAGLDRLKMTIYQICAKYQLPCPITGHQTHSYNQKGFIVQSDQD